MFLHGSPRREFSNQGFAKSRASYFRQNSRFPDECYGATSARRAPTSARMPLTSSCLISGSIWTWMAHKPNVVMAAITVTSAAMTPGTSFKFPTDPAGKSQAAPFAALLDGSKSVVVQGFLPRELDKKVFKYVGVAGVDKRRIVQVGVAKQDTRPVERGDALEDGFSTHPATGWMPTDVP